MLVKRRKTRTRRAAVRAALGGEVTIFGHAGVDGRRILRQRLHGKLLVPILQVPTRATRVQRLIKSKSPLSDVNWKIWKKSWERLVPGAKRGPHVRMQFGDLVKIGDNQMVENAHVLEQGLGRREALGTDDAGVPESRIAPLQPLTDSEPETIAEVGRRIREKRRRHRERRCAGEGAERRRNHGRGRGRRVGRGRRGGQEVGRNGIADIAEVRGDRDGRRHCAALLALLHLLKTAADDKGKNADRAHF